MTDKSEIIFTETISDFEKLSVICDKISQVLKPKTVILIDGELGSGKTTLISHLLGRFGYDQTSSPTYALRQSYPNIKIADHILKIEHLDLYRLMNQEDIDSTGLWDIFNEAENVIFIEWASRVPESYWPLDWNKYFLKISKTNSERTYQFSKI